jgi:hypothetical protein
VAPVSSDTGTGIVPAERKLSWPRVSSVSAEIVKVLFPSMERMTERAETPLPKT